MDCRNIRRDLPALFDGDLRPRRVEEVTQHLEACVDCQEADAEFRALLRRADDALAYHGAPLSFGDLQARMTRIEPLEQVIRYQLPKLKIPGTVPRFAVAMILLVALGGPTYACRHTKEVYAAAKTPFTSQKDTLTAALEDGQFPWDEATENDGHGERERPA